MSGIPWEAFLKGRQAHESWQVSILQELEVFIPIFIKTNKCIKKTAWLRMELMTMIQHKNADGGESENRLKKEF